MFLCCCQFQVSGCSCSVVRFRPVDVLVQLCGSGQWIFLCCREVQVSGCSRAVVRFRSVDVLVWL